MVHMDLNGPESSDPPLALNKKLARFVHLNTNFTHCSRVHRRNNEFLEFL